MMMVTWVWMTAFVEETVVIVQVLYNSYILYTIAKTSILPNETKINQVACCLRSFVLSLVLILTALCIWSSLTNKRIDEEDEEDQINVYSVIST